MIEFKITDEVKQRFSVRLGNQRVTFTLWYSLVTDRWSFDLSIDDAPVLTGRRVVTGVNLLRPFNLGLGLIFAWSDSEAAPDRNNLPLGVVKFYGATEEEHLAAVDT